MLDLVGTQIVGFSDTQAHIVFSGVTQEEIDEKRIETERQMLADLKKWVAEGRDLDRDFRDANGATPVRTLIIVRALTSSE